MQPAIDNKRLIILWAVVVAAYALLVVLMNPLWRVDEAWQQEIARTYAAHRIDFEARADAGEDILNPCIAALELTASELNLTQRTVVRAVERQAGERWDAPACQR